MSTDLERLNVVIAARDREFQRGMDRVIKKMDRMERQARSSTSRTSRHFAGMKMAVSRVLPALVALASVTAIKGVVNDLDNIGKTADRLGLTTDALQELRAVAESAGVGTNTLDMAMQRFGRRVAEARNGTGEAEAALEEMGIALFDGEGRARDLEDVLDDVADAMQGMSSQTDRNRLAMKLFDSEGVAMVNLLREGSRGMSQMRRDARDLGIVIDEDLIRSAESSQTQLDLMGRVIKANLSAALIELAPLLTELAREIAELARGLATGAAAIREFVDPQSELEIATSNIVLAMGDEIRQTQALRAAMATGAAMSVEMARKKLSEAMARRENARAAIEERRALALGGTQFQDLSDQIQTTQDALNSLGFPSLDVASPSRSEVFEQTQQHLADLLNERQALLNADGEMVDQLRAIELNIATLESALAEAKGGVVDFSGALIDPVELSDRLASNVNRARQETSDLAAEVPEIAEAMKAAQTAADAMTSRMENDFLDVMTGVQDLNGFLEQTVEMIKRAAFEALLFNRGPFGSGKGGGLLGGLFSGFTSLLGGARAAGGPVQAGVPYLVNENTPRSEVFVPSQSGGVLNVPQAQAALRQSAGARVAGVIRLEIASADGVTVRDVRMMAGEIAVDVTRTGLTSYDRARPGRDRDLQVRGV